MIGLNCACVGCPQVFRLDVHHVLQRSLVHQRHTGFVPHVVSYVAPVWIVFARFALNHCLMLPSLSEFHETCLFHLVLIGRMRLVWSKTVWLYPAVIPIRNGH